MHKLLTAILVFSFVAAAGLVAVERGVRTCGPTSGVCVVEAVLGYLVAASAGPVAEAGPSTLATGEFSVESGQTQAGVSTMTRDVRMAWRSAGSPNGVAIELVTEFDGAQPCRSNEQPAG